MLFVARAGQGRMWRITCTTGSRVSIMLPKRFGLPAASRVSIATPSIASKPGGGARKREMVVRRTTLEVRPVVRDLLQAEHVKIGHGLRMRHDARRIEDAIGAEAPLDVPGDDLHRS